jgi:thymidylate kinase
LTSNRTPKSARSPHGARRTRGSWRARGAIVAFIGVDGAGKTSAIHNLLSDPGYHIAHAKRIYFGSAEYWIPGLFWLYRRINIIPVLRYFPIFIMQIDRQLRVFLAMYYKYMGNIVLCDRYYYDDIVGHRLAIDGVKSLPFSRRLKTFLRPRMVWRPDLTIYLDVDPAVAYRRKQDYPFEHVERATDLYRKVMAAFPEAVFVDANRPGPEVQRDITRHLEWVLERGARSASPRTGFGARALNYVASRLTAACLRVPPLRAGGMALIRHADRWHVRADRRSSALPERLASLERQFGGGEIGLTSSGALQLITKEHIHFIPGGAVSGRALSASYANWLSLREGPHAALVAYAFARQEQVDGEVFSIERLEQVRCTAREVQELLDGVRGEVVADQFAETSLDEARRILSDGTDIPLDAVARLTVRAEPGSIGLVLGDFHAGNVLRNPAGNLVVIDLDRVERRGVQLFDRIHWVVVDQERLQRRHWLSFFSVDIRALSPGEYADLVRDVSGNSMAAYFFWRQALEMRAMPLPDSGYRRRLRACLFRLLRDRAEGSAP